MTVILQVTDGTTTVNLQNTTGAQLLEKYLPVFATPTGDGTIPADVTEALPVIVRIATDDGLAATLQGIARLQQQAAMYMADPTEASPVWFYRKLTGESGGAAAGIRFLVKSMSFTPTAKFGGLFDVGPAITDGRIGVLSITHHPYGEAPAVIAASGTDGVSVLGGAVNYTDVTGDVPARLYYLGLDNLAAARTYRQYWIGFRSVNKVAAPANVVTLWECEDGGVNGADSTFTTDATASPGGGGNTKLQTTFLGTATWAWRCAITLADVTANYDDHTGDFVVLARAKVSANTAQVKLQQIGGSGSGTYRFGPVIDVADTSWNIYNLGVVSFPVRDLHSVPIAMYADSYDQLAALRIWARQKPGSDRPVLDVDCLILIPCDEYFIHAQSTETVATDDASRIAASPEDTATGVTIDTSGPYFRQTFPVEPIGAGIPTGDGRLFVCVANDNDGTAPAFGDTLDVELSYYPRWVYFRGAE